MKLINLNQKIIGKRLIMIITSAILCLYEASASADIPTALIEQSQEKRVFKSARMVSPSSTPSPKELDVSALLVQRGLIIPDIANGYERIYLEFLRGKLIYRPDPASDEGKIDLLISELENPLEEEFDLRHCGDTAQYLSINIGYRKRKNPANANKVEIWLAPKFLIERDLSTTAGHFESIMESWDDDAAPVGIFWTWGSWKDIEQRFDYIITQNLAALGGDNLYEKWFITDRQITDMHDNKVIGEYAICLNQNFTFIFI